MHERSPLDTRENHRVDQFAMLLVGEDQPSPRPSQCLMGRARDEMGDADRARVETGRNGACNVRHIDEEVGACLIGYLPEFPEIYNPRVRARACNDQFRLLPAAISRT